MKMCQPHWDQLKKRIEELGLGHLGAKTGEQAVKDMDDALSDKEPTPESYDPLMSANWMIFGNAIKYGGFYLMGAKEDGSEYCPLCEVLKTYGKDEEGVDMDQNWIKGCTDSIYNYCKEENLITPQ